MNDTAIYVKYDSYIFAVIDNIASSVPTTQNRLTLYKNSIYDEFY